MRVNDHSESKMLKLIRGNDPRPTRSYSEISKSPKDTKRIDKLDGLYLYSWGLLNQIVLQRNVDTITHQHSSVQLCASGEGHSFYINTRNEVFGCGNNKFGQLGVEGITQLLKPTLISSLNNLKITSITCGAEHTFMLTSKGEVFSWGLNIKGQLGLGMYDDISTPSLVYSLLPFGYSNGKVVTGAHKRQKSAHQTEFMETSGSIDNIMDQITQMKDRFSASRKITKKSESSDALTQIMLQNDEVVTNISCGALHTLILTSKNRLLSCGFGDGYALGHEDNQTIAEFKHITTIHQNKKSKQSPRTEKCDRIACGLSQSGCIIEGRMYIWGIVGQRDTLKFRLPTLVQVYPDDTNQYLQEPLQLIDMKMGECFALMLTSKGEVYSFGENIDGQLGIEGLTYCDNPSRVSGMPLIQQVV